MATITTFLAEPLFLGVKSQNNTNQNNYVSINVPFTASYDGFYDFSFVLKDDGTTVNQDTTFLVKVDGNEQQSYVISDDSEQTVFFSSRLTSGQEVTIEADSSDGEIKSAILAGDDILATPPDENSIINITNQTLPFTFEQSGEYQISLNLEDTNSSSGSNSFDVILEQADSDTDVILESSSLDFGSTLQLSFEDVTVEKNDILKVVFTEENAEGSIINASVPEQDNFFVGFLPGDTIITTNKVFKPTLRLSDIIVLPTQISSSSKVSTRHVLSTEKIEPLDVLLGEEKNNLITNNSIAFNLDFYDIPPQVTLNDLIFTRANLPNVERQRAEDAVFPSEIYTSFYVQNNSNDKYEQLFLTINGGENIRVETSEFQGNFHEADGYNLNQTFLSQTQLDEYKNKSIVRTSLFNQINIELSVAPKNTSLESLDDQVFTNTNFISAKERTRLPNLNPEDYVGVYLKISTNFNVNLGIPTDFSFIHFNYFNATRNEHVSFPGQVYSSTQNTYLPRMLPSMALQFVTDYQRLLQLIERTTEDLYALYPPFFEYYE